MAEIQQRKIKKKHLLLLALLVVIMAGLGVFVCVYLVVSARRHDIAPTLSNVAWINCPDCTVPLWEYPAANRGRVPEQLQPGTQVEILGLEKSPVENRDYYHVRYGESRGYVDASFISKRSPTPTGTPTPAAIKTPRPTATPRPRPTPTSRDRGSEYGAWEATQRFVKKRLLAPTTARFPSYSEELVVYMNDGCYLVGAYVDSQNAYGVLIRNHFLCMVRYTEDGQWILKRIAWNP